MSTWTDKEGRRHVGVMVAGERVHRILPEGSSARDAKQLEAEIRAAMIKKSPRIPGDPPMAAVMALYLEHAQSLRGSKTAIYHAGRAGEWVKGYKASQARECATKMIKDMSQIITHKSRKVGPAYAPATINRTLGTMKKALTLAWELGMTPENYGLHVKRLPENNAREVFLTVQQVKRIADCCSPQVRAAVWFALLTGARRGEILKVERQHIGSDTITIPASHTKTLQARVVPIVPALRPWLDQFPLRITFEGVKSTFRRAVVRAGMPEVHFHDLRHSCASILIGLGVDLYTVAKILGHKSVTTTQRYAHLQVDQQRQALEKLGAMLEPETKKASRS
jgi:integrase